MYSSDLKRTKQTAEKLSKHLKIEPVYTGILRERNLGEAVGKLKKWADENAVDDKAFNGAESRRDVWNRLLPFFDEIMGSENENILIVSHGDTLSIFSAIWLGLAPGDLNRCNLSGFAGDVSFLCEDSCGKRIIRRFSDMSFVTEQLFRRFPV